VLGPSSPAVGACLHDLAELHHDLRDFERARGYYQRSLQIARQCFPGAHPLVARCLCDLGVLYFEYGYQDEAMQLYQEALPMFREACGPDYVEVGEVLFNIALIRQSTGDLLPAFADSAAAFAIIGASYPTTHRHFARAASGLLGCWRELDTGPEAVAAQKAVIASLRPVLRGRNAPLLGPLRVSLRSALTTGDDEAAARIHAWVCELLEETTDCSPADKCEWQFMLASALRRLHKDAEAEVTLRKALRGQGALLRTERAAPGELEGLAARHMACRCYEFAYPLLQRALQLREADPGISDTGLSSAINQLGYVSMRLTRNDEAQQLLRRALRLARATEHVAPASLAAMCNNLAEVLIQTGQLEEAETLCAEALALREEAGDPSRTAVTLMTMGSLAAEKASRSADLQGASAGFRDAEHLFEASLEGHASSQSSYAEMQVELLVRYAALLSQMGETEQAAQRGVQAEELKTRVANEVWW